MRRHPSFRAAVAGLALAACTSHHVVSPQAFPILDEKIERVGAAGPVAVHGAVSGRQPHEMARTLTQHYTAFNLRIWLDLMALFERAGFIAWAPEDTALLRRAADCMLAESDKG